jgi:predicted PurR-regulated permease PerM
MVLRSSTTSRIVLVALAVIAIALLALIIYPFASALLFAAVLAGALHPWLERLSARLGGRRQLGAVLLTIGVALLVVLPVAAMTIALGRQVVAGVSYVQDTLREGGVPALRAKLPPRFQPLADRALDHLLPRGQEQIPELAEAQTGRAAAAMGGIIRTTSTVLLQVGVMLIAFFFLLLDGPRLVEWLSNVMPLAHGQTREILGDFRNVSVAVLVSSVATAGVQTVIAFAGYWLFGVPQPLFFAAVTFLVAFIPAAGGTSVSLVLAVLLFLGGHTTSALLLAAWGIVLVGFSDNLVKPLLMRGRMEIPGAVIFFALLGGLSMFGPVGLVAGPLSLSFFLTVVRLCRRELRAAA